MGRSRFLFLPRSPLPEQPAIRPSSRASSSVRVQPLRHMVLFSADGKSQPRLRGWLLCNTNLDQQGSLRGGGTRARSLLFLLLVAAAANAEGQEAEEQSRDDLLHRNLPFIGMKHHSLNVPGETALDCVGERKPFSDHLPFSFSSAAVDLSTCSFAASRAVLAASSAFFASASSFSF